MEKVLMVIGLAVLVLLFAVCIGFLLAWPVMWLWNLCMVKLGLPAITYWTAWQLYVLCSFLFKGTSVKSN